MASIFWNDILEWWIVCDRCYDRSADRQWQGSSGGWMSPAQKQQQREAAAVELKDAISSLNWRCRNCGRTMVHGEAAEQLPNPSYPYLTKQDLERSVYLYYWNGEAWQAAVRHNDLSRSVPLVDAVELCQQIPGLHLFESWFTASHQTEKFCHPLLEIYWQQKDEEERRKQEAYLRQLEAVRPAPLVADEWDDIPF